MKNFVDVDEKLPIMKTIPLSFQHLFAMFGATILVPILLKVDPSIALLMNGVGTLIYILLTKGKIPAYLGSSFAFITPCITIITLSGFAHAQSGFIFFGIFFVIISFIIKAVGIKWIDVLMPPPVMGSVVAVIGLELAPVAAKQAGLSAGANSDPKIIFVSLLTLFIGIFGSVIFRGFFKIIPILTAVVVGYISAFALHMVHYQPIVDASWLQIPKFQLPVFDFKAIVIIAPACIVVLAEHVSHLIVTGNITNRDMIKDPGLDKSLFADGISNIISGFAGSPPNTTYGENIGVMALTKVYSVWVIRGAAILAIIFSCVGKVGAAIRSIPDPVMGGVTLLLYGIIATSGIRMLVESKVDFNKSYNLVLAAVTFSIGVSGASIKLSSDVALSGMALSAVVGMLLSLVFYILGYFGLMNEEYTFKKDE
ncbi:MAG: uracil permease [Bacillota bacterium]|nr:uracil permease [Bacillota bacterium]